jgi:hypothetical protein
MNTTTTIYSIKTADDVLLFNSKKAVINYVIHNCNYIDLKAVYVKQLKPMQDGRLIFDLMQTLEYSNFNGTMKALNRVIDRLSDDLFDLEISNAPAFVINKARKELDEAFAKKTAFINYCFETLIDIE